MFSLIPSDANDPQALMRRYEPNKQTNYKYPAYWATFRLMADNVIAPSGEFRKLIPSKRGFQAASFN